jgi:bifunctional non-homologous end joining protein LigD
MRLIAPMLATAGALPDDTAERPWSFEMKYDGCRCLASVGGGREPVLWTRAMNVVTDSYPEVAEALAAAFGVRGRIVLDGELVVLEGQALVRTTSKENGDSTSHEAAATANTCDVLTL